MKFIYVHDANRCHLVDALVRTVNRCPEQLGGIKSSPMASRKGKDGPPLFTL